MQEWLGALNPVIFFIGYDPKVSHLLAGIFVSIADGGKGPGTGRGGDLKKDIVDYSVRIK